MGEGPAHWVVRRQRAGAQEHLGGALSGSLWERLGRASGLGPAGSNGPSGLWAVDMGAHWPCLVLGGWNRGASPPLGVQAREGRSEPGLVGFHIPRVVSASSQ